MANQWNPPMPPPGPPYGAPFQPPYGAPPQRPAGPPPGHGQPDDFVSRSLSQSGTDVTKTSH